MRVRLRFAKLGKVRFTSHRDVARLWERALRRAGLPVASTEGFSPRPKVHFGLALSTGHESLGEYLDVDLRDPESAAVDLDALPAVLTPLLPIGLEVQAAEAIERGTSLQEAVTSCTWRVEVPALGRNEAEQAVAALLAAPAIPVTRERKGKPVSDDLRPGILSLAVVAAGPTGSVDGGPAGPDGPVVVEAELATQPRGIRPGELVGALGTFVGGELVGGEPVVLDEGRVCRMHQWIALDGARGEPLPLDATRAAHAEARAS